VTGWRRIPGNYAISQHGGTPCAFWTGTLSANVQTSICCQGRWTSGAFFATGPATTTTTTTTTDNGIYRDVNRSFHQAFTDIRQVERETDNNTLSAREMSTLVSLVVQTQEAVNNQTSSSIAALTSSVSSLTSQVSTLSASFNTQSSTVNQQVSAMSSALSAQTATVTSISNAINRVVGALNPVSATNWQCSGSSCNQVGTDGQNVMVDAKGGTVQVRTQACGTLDLCNVATALNNLRGI